jgi:hypothetical protein
MGESLELVKGAQSVAIAYLDSSAPAEMAVLTWLPAQGSVKQRNRRLWRILDIEREVFELKRENGRRHGVLRAHSAP